MWQARVAPRPFHALISKLAGLLHLLPASKKFEILGTTLQQDITTISESIRMGDGVFIKQRITEKIVSLHAFRKRFSLSIFTSVVVLGLDIALTFIWIKCFSWHILYRSVRVDRSEYLVKSRLFDIVNLRESVECHHLIRNPQCVSRHFSDTCNMYV